jgi:hypothetical protein
MPNMLNSAELRWNMLNSAELRWNMLNSAELRWNMLNSAELGWNMLNSAELGWDRYISHLSNLTVEAQSYLSISMFHSYLTKTHLIQRGDIITGSLFG